MHLPERSTNNWDSLRLLAAWLVIFSHSFGMMGVNDPVYRLTNGVIPGGQLGVYVFFIISGYFISQSWVRKPDAFVYFRNRILRIFPGLIVVVILTVFIFGPLLSTFSVSDYFKNPMTFQYLWNISLWKTAFILPGVFNGRLVNAPLWTLFFEFLMYISVAAFGLLSAFSSQRGKYFILLLFSLLVFSLILPKLITVTFLKINIWNLIRFATFFYSGVIFFLFREKFNVKTLIGIGLGFIVLLVWRVQFALPAAVFFISVFVLYVGSLKVNTFNFITHHGDFSYGFYLYGFIVQSTLLYFGLQLHPVLFFIVSLLFTAPFAIFSWKVVERPFLLLKKRKKIKA